MNCLAGSLFFPPIMPLLWKSLHGFLINKSSRPRVNFSLEIERNLDWKYGLVENLNLFYDVNYLITELFIHLPFFPAVNKGFLVNPKVQFQIV